jgi:hypothetical protein
MQIILSATVTLAVLDASSRRFSLRPGCLSRSCCAGNFHASSSDEFAWVPANSRCATEQPGESMLCANPHCSKELLFREGRAELIELELGARDREWIDEGGFPVKSAPSRFFWLCGDCAKKLIIKRWTSSGLLLAPRKQGMAGRRPTRASSSVVPGEVHDSADLAAAV